MTTAFLVREGVPLDEAFQVLKRERGVDISPRQMLGLSYFKDSLARASTRHDDWG